MSTWFFSRSTDRELRRLSYSSRIRQASRYIEGSLVALHLAAQASGRERGGVVEADLSGNGAASGSLEP